MTARQLHHIVMVTLGTMGDVLPFAQLASSLSKRGYRVSILTSTNWEKTVLEHGAEFVEIAGPDPYQDQKSHENINDMFISHRVPSFYRSFEYIEKSVDHKSAILVYWFNSLGAECAAIKFNIPSVQIILSPQWIFSFIAPPHPFSLIEKTAPGYLAKSRIVQFYLRIRRARQPIHRASNRFRASVGCRPVDSKLTGQRNENCILSMFPEWYAPPQADWPSHSQCVGFPGPQKNSEDSDVSEFIKRAGPPIVFTPGTGLEDPSSFFDTATEVCGRLNAPGIFLHPAAPKPASDVILTRSYLDLDSVLPFSRLFVHHGGIGSTAAAIRAGVPQIICPIRFDQPDNGERVTNLQIGRTVSSKALDANKLCSAIGELEADHGLPARLAKFRAATLECNGTENAADAIIALLSEV
jgi:rhamnosyltransferase subunit B